MCLDVFIILFFLTLNGPSAAALTQETGVEVCCSMGEGSLVIRPSLTNPLMAFEKPCGATRARLSHSEHIYMDTSNTKIQGEIRSKKNSF